MSHTVCLAARTLHYLHGGGHFWAYLNWALGLRACGCAVIWLEAVDPSTPCHELHAKVALLKSHLAPYGLAESVALCSRRDDPLPQAALGCCLDLDTAAEADLLLNFLYEAPAQIVGRFRRSALVDIDPGLLQLWMSTGRIRVAPHDIYFSVGETVGQRGALFPDCGLEWHYTPRAMFLPAWPPTQARPGAPYTTVSDWWERWLEIHGVLVDNSKRVTFLDYADLPSRTSADLELALTLGKGDEGDRSFLEHKGWKIRHAWDVTSTPEAYRSYLQESRGEFSCAKPSCMLLQNAWISDRTLCYLASGKPAIVQHTGPSSFLPDAQGLFRFRSLEEAACALSAAETEYERHCRLARALVEEHFDAQKVVAGVLEQALA